MQSLEQFGLQPKPFDDVIFVSYPGATPVQTIEVFYFPFGCLTIWGADEAQEHIILAAADPFTLEKLSPPIKDAISYQYQQDLGKTSVDEEANEITLHDDSTLVKLSISHALAQSVKLSSLEQSIALLLEQTLPIRQELATQGSVSLSKKQTSKQIGILFNERYSVNLHNDILDTPEFFWRKPGYEPLYLMTAEFQDIQVRQNILNRRLDMIHELYDILSNELNYKHTTKLEITVVILIGIEILLAISHNNSLQHLLNFMFP